MATKNAVNNKSEAFEITSGDLTVTAGNTNLPDTNSAGTQGTILINSNRFIHKATSASNTFIGTDAGNFTNNKTNSTGVGNLSLMSLSAAGSGSFNAAFGSSSGTAITTGGSNTAVGHAALVALTTGDSNVSVGTNSMTTATSASYNTAVGNGSTASGGSGPLYQLTTGSNNIAIGGGTGAGTDGPGFNYTSTESSNICIGNKAVGTIGESNKIRIGTTGVGAGQQDTCYLAGTVVADTGLTVTTGDATISAGNINLPEVTGATVGVLTGEPNTATGATRLLHTYNPTAASANLFLGYNAGNFTLTTAVRNECIGASSYAGLTTGTRNVGLGESTGVRATTGILQTYIGNQAGAAVTTGTLNTYVGGECGANFVFNGGVNSTGSYNDCFGAYTLAGLTTGSFNVAIGGGEDGGARHAALTQLTTGSNNICIGGASAANTGGAGYNYTSSESSNICIGNATVGTAAESNVMRLGTHGSGAGQVNKAFIAGVRGVTTGVADAIAVLVDSAHQFGTVSSSIRVKKNVEDMSGATDNILDLRPVLFDYIDSPSERRQYGLIAEEVEKIMPDLVVYDKSHTPESVRYHELPVMLLNEMKKMKNTIQDLLKRIDVLESNRR